VYRSTISGGPYVRLASRVPDVSYIDTPVNSKQTYFYVVTAVDQSNRESKHSNEARAMIP
jgi:fibronectin type 3 domain-containing protein